MDLAKVVVVGVRDRDILLVPCRVQYLSTGRVCVHYGERFRKSFPSCCIDCSFACNHCWHTFVDRVRVLMGEISEYQ